MKQVFYLHGSTQRNAAARAIEDAGDGAKVTIGPPGRSLDQNAQFHAICSDLAHRGIYWAGKPREAEEWKLLLVSAHSIATKHEIELVNGIEGELVNLRERTSKMDKERMSSLISYSEAFLNDCIQEQESAYET